MQWLLFSLRLKYGWQSVIISDDSACSAFYLCVEGLCERVAAVPASETQLMDRWTISICYFSSWHRLWSKNLLICKLYWFSRELISVGISYTVIFIECVVNLYSFIYCFCPSGERDPPLLLSWRFLPFFPCERVVWEFFLIRCEVLGQGCCMCTDCKALWGEFVICENGLYKINWIELNCGLSLQYNWLGHR